MKKRYFIGIMIAIALVVIAITMVVLSKKDNPLVKISVFSWDRTDEFVLCEIEGNGGQAGVSILTSSCPVVGEM